MFADLDLPVRAPEYSWADLRVALTVDKKTVGGMPRFVLASEIGTVSIGNEIPEDLMEQIWKGL